MFRQPVHEQIEQLPADLVQSVRTLSLRLHPGTSAMGILWLTLTLAVMLILAAGKHHTGKQLDNPVLLTEGRVTLVDALLVGAVLGGLVLNALLGWWWADPMASLIVTVSGTSLPTPERLRPLLEQGSRRERAGRTQSASGSSGHNALREGRRRGEGRLPGLRPEDWLRASQPTSAMPA
jgi:hypothetical protein